MHVSVEECSKLDLDPYEAVPAPARMEIPARRRTCDTLLIALSGTHSVLPDVENRMPYAVAYSFEEFFKSINLNGDYRETANARRDDIVSTLKKDFDIIDSFSTGSIPKYTAIKNHADLDVMVVLHFAKHIKEKTPTQVLQSVRDALAEWRTGVRRNGQAVTLSYKTWPDVDIVPVSQSTNDAGDVTHYNVPDANTDTWIKSRPKALVAAIEAKSSSCGYNFRRIIKMMKHWNRIHSSYLTSYHIEILALNVFDSDLDDTPWQVHRFFDKARSFLQSSLWYDLGFVDDYLSACDRTEVLKRFDVANSKSLTAWYKTHDTNDDHKGAIELWRQIFGDKFPAHG